ncbi:TetR/AcrR family transcriptional regulator [Thermomonospora amylolytica]|uniref:TetR/AcrR family transcriptional regulator n=1 Tax=Thermomonospora amylolytica TaxID=1411117 RepID=UPI000E6D26B3|nr:TetR/AcrR family transcriptional regulator [Thermomonospora amylolytica]
MGRPAKFTEERILDAALAIAAEDGPGAVTMTAVGARLGAPTGSLYHRFGSRDLLMARLWMRCVRNFQQGFGTALRAGDAEAAALHTPRWCREHPDEAALLVLHRRRDLAAKWPAALSEDLSALNTEVIAALDAFTAAHPRIDRERLVFAVIDVPYGAVRRHLMARRPPPPQVDDLIKATCRAVLSLES